MTTEIRRYCDNDLDAMLNAWENASRLAHPFMSNAFFARERQNIPELYLPNADTWVALYNGRVVGFIALIGNEVGGLFVDPALHGQGLGKALMDKAGSLHEVLEVEVFKANAIGRAFYARYGFQFLREKIFEPTGDPLLRLRYCNAQLED